MDTNCCFCIDCCVYFVLTSFRKLIKPNNGPIAKTENIKLEFVKVTKLLIT